MTNNAHRLINIWLQGTTFGTRFLFVFFVAKYLDPASVGYYGLFTATIGYGLYFVGLDFYTYTTREILKTPNGCRGKLLKAQAALSGILYLIFLPVSYFLIHYANWPLVLVTWFVPLLVFEHFNQEVSRLLVALSEQIAASAITFIRQGSWAVVSVAIMTWAPDNRRLQTIMLCWAVAGICSALVGLWKLKQLGMGGWHDPINWGWIKKGVAVSITFLIATLALRGVQTFDRYWLEALAGIELVGAYVLFFGVANTLMVFLDAGVFAYAYPELIKLYQQNQYNVAQHRIQVMFIYTTILSIGFGIVSWWLLPYLLIWISNPIYLKAINLYPWLLAATVMSAFSMVPHYALYARGNDKHIVRSHIAAFIAFAASVLALSFHFPTLAVPMGLNVSFAVILLWKTIAFLQDRKEAASGRYTPFKKHLINLTEKRP